MRALIILSTVVVLGCNGGLVDDGQSVCDLAARHVSSCSDLPLPASSGSCDSAAAAEANTLLGTDCDTLASMAPASGGRTAVSGSQACSDEQLESCEAYCVELFDSMELRLKSTRCEVLPPGTRRPDGEVISSKQVHCQCKGYWWPW